MEITPSLLEDWLRDYYFTCEIDIGGSGVEDFSLAELREHTGLTQAELDAVIFHDSPSCGQDALRHAIARRWGNNDPQRVMATVGSSEALFLLMHALLRPGDEVVVVDPSYPSLVHIAESIKCRLKYWRLRFESRYIPDLDELKSLISPQTRMLIVNFPHNPTGASLDAEQQARLIEMAASVGAYIVWDNAFAELTYERPPLPEPGLLYERAISTGTLSKGYGLPGLRVGWCFASPEVLKLCVNVRDYISLALSPLVELVALRAIEKADVLLGMRLRQARNNLQILSDWVSQHHGYVEWVPPQGGVTAFPRFPRIKDMDAFCHHLARSHKLLLVPGICFNHPRHVRLGFGGATHTFQQGLSKLSGQLLAYSA
jgi:capreomycidine synthase